MEKSLAESQRLMVKILLEFHHALSNENNQKKLLPVWITGYSEMKKGGVFEVYTNELKVLYDSNILRNKIFLYRHFSMNQFTIDLGKQTAPGEKLFQTLERIGSEYRRRFLWEE